MARVGLTLILCQVLTLPIMGGSSEESGIEDLLSAFMQNSGENGENPLPGVIGNVMGALMQGGNGGGGNGAAEILSGLGSLLGGQNGQIDPSLVGTMVSMFAQSMAQPKQREKRVEKSGDAGINLEGLGSLLGGQNGQIDPSVIGSVVSMFAQSMAQPKQREKRAEKGEDAGINLEGLMGMFSNSGGSLLPLIMNGLSSIANANTEKLAREHKEHASFLPPFVEKLHLYWDIFINSELGKTLWEKSGLKRALKAFEGPDGKISFELMFKNFENHSFRRHWIKAAAKYVTDMVVHVAKPEVYKRYLVSAEYFINGFLDSQGLPKSTHFDVKKPEKSISVLVNHVLKQYLDMETDVSGYVKPAVDYTKQLLKMAQTTSQSLASRSDYNALADKVTDTLNLEVIEPVLRVYRAYKHSLKAPQCQEHLMCLVNKHHDKDKAGLPGFKAGLTKFSSLVASAALSFQNGKGFWDLYNAIQNDVNCEAAYPADCSAFHEHEMKVTTEVYHSEL